MLKALERDKDKYFVVRQISPYIKPPCVPRVAILFVDCSYPCFSFMQDACDALTNHYFRPSVLAILDF
jgi:hypothetical protein